MLTLPSCVFINGHFPLATELANALSDRWQGAQAHSFDAPLRDGALGTFFQGDPSIDIQTLLHTPCIPDSATTYEVFLKNYLAVLKMSFGETILATLALRRLEENTRYFSTFVFDDATDKMNIRPIADHFGRANCLIVNLTPTIALKSKTIPNLLLEETNVLSLVTSLETYLEGNQNVKGCE